MELRGQDLCCERGGREVFAGLSFAVKNGEMLVLKGPNGVGKTSLLRMIAGLNEPSEGGFDVTGAQQTDLGLMCHFVAHQEAFKPALTVEENLQFWADFFGGGDVEKALAAFNLLPLAGFSAAVLSAGQKRRLALARLVMIERPLWLLDEPSVGLDSQSVGQLQELIRAHLKNDGLVIATTHVDLGIKGARVFDFAEQGVGR